MGMLFWWRAGRGLEGEGIMRNKRGSMDISMDLIAKGKMIYSTEKRLELGDLSPSAAYTYGSANSTVIWSWSWSWS